MSMFGARSPFLPMLQAAMAGQIPGIIREGQYPRMMAQALGAPVPASPVNQGAMGGPSAPRQDITYSPARAAMGTTPAQMAGRQPGMFGARPAAGGGPLPAPNVPHGPAAEAMIFETGPLAVDSQINGGVPNVSAKMGHKGLFPGKDWKTIVPMVANALLAASARTNPASMAMLQNNMLMQRERQRQDYEMRLPQQVGGSMVRLNPESGQYDTLYREPEPFEQYASALGYQPGSPEYIDAVQNYRLGAWSDPAVQAKLGLTGYRYDRQGELQEDRQAYGHDMQEDRQTFSNGQLTRRLSQSDTNNRRSTGVSRENNIRTTGQSAANSERSAETARGAYSYMHGGGRGSGKGAGGGGSDLVGPVHTKGSQRIQFNRKLGSWVDLSTGQPVK